MTIRTGFLLGCLGVILSVHTMSTAAATPTCKADGGEDERRIQDYLNKVNADYAAAHAACNASEAKTVEALKKECAKLYHEVHEKHRGLWKKELGLCFSGEHA